MERLEIAAQILSFQLVAVSFFHFVLIFPDGRSLSKKAKRVLTSAYITIGIITVVEFYFNVFNNPNATDSIKTLSRYIRYFDFVLVFGAALVMLLIKYTRSQHETRVRLRLAVMSLVISVSFPFATFILNGIFDLLQDWVVHKFAILLIPTIAVPIFFAYALVKNRLFGVDIKIRRFITYGLVITLVTVVYYATSIVLTTVLPLSKQIESEPVFNILYLVVITELLHLFFRRIQRFVDKRFQVDPLNYQELSRRWTNYLAGIHDLLDTCTKLSRELPADYHYKNATLLLCEPSLLNFFLGVSVAKSKSKSLAKMPGMLINAAGDISTTPIDQAFLSTLAERDWLINEDDTLPIEVKNRLQHSQVALALPLKIGSEVYGAVLLGEKVSEYSPPPSDEIEQLHFIANQIAATLRNSMLLVEAKNLAEKEKQLRLDSEEAAKREQIVRRETLKVVSITIHNDPIQDLVLLKKKIDNNATNSQSFSELAPSLAQDVTNVENSLRVITAQLGMFGKDPFTIALRNLIVCAKLNHDQVV